MDPGKDPPVAELLLAVGSKTAAQDEAFCLEARQRSPYGVRFESERFSQTFAVSGPLTSIHPRTARSPLGVVRDSGNQLRRSAAIQ